MSYFFYDIKMASEHITPEQAKAGRALLAWSQVELAGAAKVATSTVADFERGSRTPVANNAQAIKSALESRGLQFVANGVVEKALMSPAAPALKPGNLMKWVTATHLAQWGESRDGQSSLPELIRRLIYASIGPAAYVSFPADDSVQHPGYDGTCTSPFQTQFIPEGRSVWELGAQRRGTRGKADGDLTKREINPLGEVLEKTTFVFVTPQRFTAKSKWIAEKKAEGCWKDVRVIDADELVTWLEMYPGVSHWLATKLNRKPEGLRGIEDVWREWLQATKTPINQDILLTDRDAEATAIRKWLREGPQLLAIQGESPEEVMAFLFASLCALPEAYRLSYISHCVIAEDQAIARQLLGLGTPLIIVLSDPDPGIALRLVQEGHHVFSVCGSDSSEPSLRLSRPWTFSIQQALERANFSNEDAYRFSKSCGRSLTVLRRLLPAAPYSKPEWARSASPELIVAMLAGGWSSSRPADKKFISILAGTRYEDFEERLAMLAVGTDAPLILVGEIWKVVSLRDLWTLVGGQVTEGHIKRYTKVFLRIFCNVDPRFDIIRDENYIEHVEQFTDEASGILRRGLLETLLAIGVYPKVAKLIPNNESTAEKIVQQLFNAADNRVWWSLSNDFGRLAEAAPKAFLNAVELALEGEDPPIMSLFRSDPGFITSREYLSHLLWALELLARSPDYLTRAALVLARLDEIDPGGQWANRPSASLRRIFVSWSPQTYATLEQRTKVISKIIRHHPQVGWKLLIGLAPKSHDMTTPSSKPEWRDFAPGEPEVITHQTIGRAAQFVGRELLKHAGNDLVRWTEILEHWPNFAPEWREEAARELERFVQTLSQTSDKETVRELLRQMIQKHRNFPDADWSLDEAELSPLETVFSHLTPESPQEKFRWLFRQMNAGYRPGISWDQQRQELETARDSAVEQLLANLTDAELFDFAKTITFTREFGASIAKSPTADERRQRLLKEGLLSSSIEVADTGMGLLWSLSQNAGVDWLANLWQRAISEAWGEEAELRIVTVMPNTPTTWNAVAARSAEFENHYWQRQPVYLIPEEADADFVVDRFVAAGRARHAVAWLGNISDKRSKGSINGQTMIKALREAITEEPSKDSNDATMFSYYLGLVLDRLERESAASEKELVQLEWIYFQALRYSQRPARKLHEALAKDASFFVDLQKMIFLPSADSGIIEEPRSTPELMQEMAHQAWNVLRDWKIVPGSTDDGEIDPERLEAWVKDARKLLHESGRSEIGDQKIGEILSAAKRNGDEPWPPEPVRDIIELVRSKQLEVGFEIGLYNRRGVTVRMPLDGGAQERSLASIYKNDADALRFDWPRTAACLDRIAEYYELDARREDETAIQRDWL